MLFELQFFKIIKNLIGVVGDRKFFVVLVELWNQGRIPYSEERSDKEKSIEIQSLSGHEAWTLFARIAFKVGHAPMELEDSIADECKGFPLALNAAATTLKDKSCVDE